MSRSDKPTSATDETREFEGGLAKRYGRIWVLFLNGSSYQMGRQHGGLLRPEIQTGLFRYYLETVYRFARRSSEISQRKLAAWTPFAVKKWFLDTRTFPRLTRHQPLDVHQEITGLSETAQLPLDEMVKGTVVADTMLYFLGKGYAAVPRLVAETAFNACTSLAAWGDATAEGSYLYGRNLDFFGVGVWDEHPVVLFCKPESGQNYVSIASAGVGMASITAMNESGLTVALHINRSRCVSLSGIPMLYLSNRLLREAGSLDEALRIAQRSVTAVGFCLFVTDARHRTAAALECSAKGVFVRQVRAGEKGARCSLSECLWQTNHFLCPEQQADELDVSASIRAHSVGRYRRVEEWMRQHHGTVTAQKMAHLLGDHHDPLVGRERAIGNIITQPNNISSVVFEPEKGRFWVAEGKAPVSHSRYLCFDWEALERGETGCHPPLEGASLSEPARAQGNAHYMRAYVASLNGGNEQEVLRQLELAVEADPSEAIYHYLEGLCCLRSARLVPAIRHLEQALRLDELATKKTAIQFWKGVAEYLAERREDAKETWRRVAQASETPHDIRQEAEKALLRPPGAEILRRIVPDFQFGDVILAP